MVYIIELGGRMIRLFDTPGIGDTRGVQYDKQNTADILGTLSKYDELHGILILLKSNSARLTIMFEFCVKELLTHLHRTAVANMAFGFTNTRISNYTPGDTFGPLKAILASQKDVDIALDAHTVYCFDSESFRYLAATKNNVPMANEDNFGRSWERSRDEARRLIARFEELPPHPVVSLNSARRLVSELTKPMAEISALIRVNIANLTDQMQEYKAMVKNEGIETQIRENATDVQLWQAATQKLSRVVRECEGEQGQIREAAARLGLFLKQNSITAFNDKTLEYLDHLIREEEAEVQHGGRDAKLRGLLEDRRKHVELVGVLEREMDRGARYGGCITSSTLART